MTIKINNFGPIKSCTIDIDKEITVIYGNNNIGKSYAMQVVYLLLKSLKSYHTGYYVNNMQYYEAVEFMQYLQVGGTNRYIEKLEGIVRDFRLSGKDDKEITSVINSTVALMFKTSFFDSFINSCKSTFGNFEKNLDNNPTITLNLDYTELLINLKDKTIDGNFSKTPVYLKRSNSSFHKSRNAGGKLSIYVCNEDDTPCRVIYEKSYLIYREIRKSLNIENVYFLPASRSGIYSGMSAFGSIVAELSKNRALITRKIELPGISEPISDYFISLSSIKNLGTNALEDIYGEIESEILKGEVLFDKNKKTLTYTSYKADLKFEMTEVSSMVSEISPIVAFLKYIVGSNRMRSEKKAIMFIEEPEAHLHPSNQTRLIEVFSKLPKHGIKLVASSHSNYIFNKLNNLVLDRKLNYLHYDPILLEDTAGGSVSKSMDIDNLGVVDENFIDISEELMEERMQIIERLNDGD